VRGNQAQAQLRRQYHDAHAQLLNARETIDAAGLLRTLDERAQRAAAASDARRPSDLVAALRALYCRGTPPVPGALLAADALDWDGLAASVAHMARAAPACSHMHGPLAAVAQQRSRAAPRPRQRAAAGPVVRPGDESCLAREVDKQETDHIAEELLGALQRHGSVALALLVLNPRSFAQSVENLFSLSFLVRDGLARLAAGQGGQVVVQALEQRRKQAGDSSQADSRLQFVMSLDMAMWERIRSVVPAAECLMAHREPYQAPAAATAAGQ
jgi:hypothetical protein